MFAAADERTACITDDAMLFAKRYNNIQTTPQCLRKFAEASMPDTEQWCVSITLWFLKNMPSGVCVFTLYVFEKPSWFALWQRHDEEREDLELRQHLVEARAYEEERDELRQVDGVVPVVVRDLVVRVLQLVHEAEHRLCGYRELGEEPEVLEEREEREDGAVHADPPGRGRR